MNKSDLLKLAERGEALSGPDTEVDSAIVLALFPVMRVPSSSPNGQDGWYDSDRIFVNKSWHFTGSLDAAMTLVPEGCEWAVNWGGNSVAEVNILPDGPLFKGYADTPALALCAAALRSLAKEDS